MVYQQIYKTCPVCKGSGLEKVTAKSGTAGEHSYSTGCTRCNGEGKIPTDQFIKIDVAANSQPPKT